MFKRDKGIDFDENYECVSCLKWLKWEESGKCVVNGCLFLKICCVI